ncbi:3-(3-hydroxydecanoyloxy)decanoate synthase [Pantoea ananatis]|nr:3-(3-hydroxydecanoyloxy)decanoate synthase [Pantoea ananatis]
MSHAYSVININKLNVYVELVKCSVPTRNRTILINGALATSSSFRNWKRFLADKSDVITFDLPFSGKSKPYNEQDCHIVTLDDEVAIIREIISIYKPNIIASASWGGASTLKLLNNGEDGLEHAIIASYSFEFNDRMRTYVKQANLYSKEKKFVDLAHLMNDEVGAYLPNKMKFCNFRHLTTLDEIEYRQGRFHLEQIANIRNHDYKSIIDNSACQFHFINGDLDIHTPQKNIEEICGESDKTCFYQIRDAGHFLDLEGKVSRERTAAAFNTIFNQIGV